MIDTKLTADGQATLDMICNRWAPIMRESRRVRILRVIGWMLRDKGIQEAGKAEVLEGARFIISGGFAPFFDQIDDMADFKKIQRTPYLEEAAYFSMPRYVKRWPNTPTKPAKNPADMNILAFNASPRLNGNTLALMEAALDGARSAGAVKIETVHLQKLKLGFCIGCRKCKAAGWDGQCSIKDDMSAIYPKIIAADIIIIGFPIYTGRECAQLSTFLDRWDCFERYTLGKQLKPGRRAMVIGTWGYNRDNTYDHIIENIMTVINLHEVEPVEAISACGFIGKYNGLDKERKAIIRRFPEEMKKVSAAGKTLVTGV